MKRIILKINGWDSRIFDVAFIIIVTLPFIPLISHTVIQSFTDFYLPSPYNFSHYFQIWSDNSFGSSTSGELWRLFPLKSLFYLGLNVMHLSSGIAEYMLLSALFIAGFLSFKTLFNTVFAQERQNVIVTNIAAMFFVFNTYSLTQLTNSFLLVIPYLFLPLQILLYLKILSKKSWMRYLIILAVVNASIFGVNLIFDVISIFLFIAIILWGSVVTKEYKIVPSILKLTISIGISLLICTFWLLPLLYTSLTETATTSYVLQSEDFYNLDSSIKNVLRGLGDWGFFGSNNGVPYNAFSSLYKSNWLVIIAGFVFPALALFPLIFLRDVSSRPSKLFIALCYFLLFLVIPFIGGTHAGWPTAGIVGWMFSHIPYFKAFRNTYKFASIEMLLVALLFGLAVLIVFKRINSTYMKPIFLIALFALICINAFPFVNGQVFSDTQKSESIPDYWRSAAHYINQNLPSSSKVLMLPDQYSEVFYWNNQLRGFPRNLEETLINKPIIHNTCKGCAAPGTAEILTNIYSNLDSPKSYSVLEFLGVSHLLQRNDYASNYYKSQSPEQIKDDLSQIRSINKVKSFGQLDLYSLPQKNVYPMLYSPSTLVETGKVSEMSDIVGNHQLTNGYLGVILSDQTAHKTALERVAKFYRRLFDIDETDISNDFATESIRIGKTDKYNLQIGNSNNAVINYYISYKTINGELHLILQPVKDQIKVDEANVSNLQASNAVDILIGQYNTDVAVKLGNKAYILKNDGNDTLGTLAVNSKNLDINIFALNYPTMHNLLNNGSLETGLWQKSVSDCQQNISNAKLAMRVSNDASDGNNSLYLSAQQDTACTYTPSISNFESGTYIYAFDAKNIKGHMPSYCVWDGQGCVNYSNITKSSKWETYSGAAVLGDNASNVNLFFYAQKSNYAVTENEYDNVRIYHLGTATKVVHAVLNNDEVTPRQLNLSAGYHKLANQLQLDKTNLVDNGSFESGLWAPSVSNCSEPGISDGVSMAISHNSYEGHNSLELKSSGDIACTSSDIVQSFSRDGLYEFSFDYKILNGSNAQFCIYDGQTCLIYKTFSENDSKWHKYAALIKPSSNSKRLNVYFYASGKIQRSDVLYDSVKINRVNNNFLGNYILTSSSISTLNSANDIKFTEIQPTKYKLKFKLSSSAPIIFEQSYSPDWKMYVISNQTNEGRPDRFAISENNHFIANSFMNGWWIDKNSLPTNYIQGDGTIELEIYYSPQKLVYEGVVVTGSVTGICMVYLGYDIVRNRMKNSKPGLLH